MTPVYVEINRWLALVFERGVNDCGTVVADWVQKQRGVDPMQGIRLTYSSAGECERVTGFLSNPLAITTQCFEGVAGLEPTDNPEAGDVGVMRLKGQSLPVCGVFTGSHWAIFSERSGVVMDRRVDLLKAWRV